MADSTLNAIRTKIRRLTRTPSTAQLPDATIDEYINTFILYDLPEHLRLFSLRTTHTFYTQPYQDRYPTDISSFGGVTTNPLYNFKNKFITVHPPVYVDGFQAFYSQSREEFFNIYPFINSRIDTGLRGNGITQVFSGTISPPANITPTGGSSLLQGEVNINSVDINNNGLAMVDKPLISGTFGNNITTGNLFQAGTVPVAPITVTDPANTVDYVTGVFTVTFTTPPASGEPIYASVRPQQVARPSAVLYYHNEFIVRPVPDAAYSIEFEAYRRPTELLASGDIPELEQWWQYIAYGGAKKIFEDRSDTDSVQLIYPEFKEQQKLVVRRTIVQQTNERTATIYQEQSGIGTGFTGFGSGGGQF